ncbi:MAG: Rpn family recombination-promoting nuclease/putative transposase [Eubacteriales bacterium]|nr:Rpn family recombination-promoting nuclease/putative transposase [Eubacteriales bacterium]
MGKESPIKDAKGTIDYGMTNDYMFRATLQKSKKALIGLTSVLLHLQPEQIMSIEITNPIILGETIDSRTYVLDVNIVLNNNRMLNLEMQVNNLHDWEERSLCYLCGDFSQLNEGEPYKNIKPVLNIGILDYTLCKEEPKFYAKYYFFDEKTHRLYSDKLGIGVLDLTQIAMATEEDKMYGIDTWARIFKAKTWEELRMAVKNNEYMEEAVETMYTLNADKTVRQQCEARRRAEIEEKYLQDEMERLTKEKDELTKKMNQMTEEKDQMTKDIDRLKQESDIWKEKYEKLLAEQNA